MGDSNRSGQNLNKTVSLVLGSGGARGFAHIGVIRWLEENNFKIESITGCSIGALVGGAFAAGKLNEFEEWIRGISKSDIISLLDISWRKSGLVSGDKLIKSLTELVGEKDIDELSIPYTAVAADLANEKEIWISSGKLFDAIRASISLPLFFTPFRYGKRDLIDGGIVNPVPIAPTFNDQTDLTIAVNLVGQIDEDENIFIEQKVDENNDITDENSNNKNFTDKFADKTSEMIDSVKGFIPGQESEKGWNAYDIANQSIDIMQSTIARQKLAAYPADHVIEISRKACGILEFDRAAEMIELGYNKAKQSLQDFIED